MALTDEQIAKVATDHGFEVLERISTQLRATGQADVAGRVDFVSALFRSALSAQPAPCGEYVAVRADAVEWLKNHYPALCEKSGMCERVAGRLYTRTTLSAQPAKPAITDEQKAALVDPDDGENRAVRYFLMMYGGQTCTIEGMRKHLQRSGFPYWPEWAERDGHLTKGGAQAWIRYLIGLESALSAQPAIREERALMIALLREWHDMFAHARRDGTQGADLIDRTALMLQVSSLIPVEPAITDEDECPDCGKEKGTLCEQGRCMK